MGGPAGAGMAPGPPEWDRTRMRQIGKRRSGLRRVRWKGLAAMDRKQVPLRVVTVAVAIMCLWAFASPRAAEAQDPEKAVWEKLQAKGAVIAGIDIRIINVFDPAGPESRYWFARAADFIHITTREHVVRRELQFKVGDPVDASKIIDSERALRYSLDIARDATILPERVEGHKVWVLVVFKDAWTLGLDANYGHVGGQNKYTFRIHERNFLGLGKGLLISHQRTFERSINEFAYYDPQLFGSLWTLNTNYQQLSDGRARLFDVAYPFYTVDTPFSFEVKATDALETLTLYNLTHSVYAMRNLDQYVTATATWAYHVEGFTAYRIGLGLVSQQSRYFDFATYRPGYLPPLDVADRRLRGPEVTWEWFQDRYRDFEDMATIGRGENYNLGWDVQAALGYYGRSFGSAGTGPFFSLAATKGWVPDEENLLLERASLAGRREFGTWRNLFLTQETTWYNQAFPYQTLAGDLRIDWGQRPDPENWLYLGGIDGMRGYPNHFLAGDRRWIFSFEDRVITPWSLWGLARVGFVGYMDAGAIRAFGASGWGKTYSDVGGGLRFGNLKARTAQVLELTVAVPLVKTPLTKGYEIVAGTVIRF